MGEINTDCSNCEEYSKHDDNLVDFERRKLDLEHPCKCSECGECHSYDMLKQ